MNEEQQGQNSLQQAYRTTSDVYQYVRKDSKRSLLTVLFGLVAGVGSAALVPNPWVAPIIIDAVFMYDTYQKRKNSLHLAKIFNEVTKDMAPEAKKHLRDIENQLQDVREINPQDLNLKKHWENKNFMGVGFIGYGLLFAQPVLPAFLALMVGNSDSKRNAHLSNAAVKAAEEMERIYSKEQLKQPSHP